MNLIWLALWNNGFFFCNKTVLKITSSVIKEDLKHMIWGLLALFNKHFTSVGKRLAGRRHLFPMLSLNLSL